MSEAYKRAGVDINAGYQAIAKIKEQVKRTHRKEVVGGLGGFAGMFALPSEKYHNPVLVAGTDGVGTKLKLGFLLDKHNTIGIDLVAMCVNDIVVQGAEPLFFLDYIALERVEPDKVASIVEGIAEGCVQANCALIGGETAEMPGFYQPHEYDVAGFCVGIAERDDIIDGSDIQPGDRLLGLPSTGLHSNGFSLVRKLLLDEAKMELNKPFAEGSRTLGDELMTPTRIYAQDVLGLLAKHRVKGMSHITGGGFIENIPRILPEGCSTEIHVGSWPVPSIFRLLQDIGGLTQQEMFNTFNMGIGLVMVVAEDEVPRITEYFQSRNESVCQIGTVNSGNPGIDLRGIK